MGENGSLLQIQSSGVGNRPALTVTVEGGLASGPKLLCKINFPPPTLLQTLLKPNFDPSSRQRPYHVENTSSRPITEVKQRWARLVLGWMTAWEHRVLLSFL